MHSQLTLIVAQQHIADLRRAADHDRLVQAATTASRSDAPTAGRPSPPRPSRSFAGSAATSLKRTRPHGKAGQVEGERMPAATAKQAHNRMSFSPCMSRDPCFQRWLIPLPLQLTVARSSASRTAQSIP